MNCEKPVKNFPVKCTKTGDAIIYSVNRVFTNFYCCVQYVYYCTCRSQWPRGVRRGSVAARLLRLLVRIPSRARFSVCCVVYCQVEVSATSRMWFVVLCDFESL